MPLIHLEGAVNMWACYQNILFKCFMHAIPRVNLLVILIKLAILIYFYCVPTISIAISIILI